MTCGAVLRVPRFLARAGAGKQDGLACRPGPVSSSAHSVQHVKSVTGCLPVGQHAPECPVAAGGTAGPDAADGGGPVRNPGGAVPGCPGRGARNRDVKVQK